MTWFELNQKIMSMRESELYQDVTVLVNNEFIPCIIIEQTETDILDKGQWFLNTNST